MARKYLLYIDILGFSDLVRANPELYQVINSLNVYRHDVFHTLVFSDTILVYNKIDPGPNGHSYMIMYSIEFAQDLFYRLIGKGIFFRATVRYGDFTHNELSNIDAYHGDALISSYTEEKKIPATGVFIHRSVWDDNDIFHTVPFTDEYKFALVNQALLSAWEMAKPNVPFWFSAYDFWNMDYPGRSLRTSCSLRQRTGT